MFFVRKRFDTDTPTLLRALAGCLAPGSPETSRRRIDARWGGRGESIACLSVRTAFDLLLQSVDWPKGSEVAMTAVTIPHMVSLVRAHGYVPVAIDLELTTMAPTMSTLEAALTPRTRAVVVAHLFGARSDTGALIELARSRGLLFIEDCAQCYDPRDRSAESSGLAADVELYSFGSIKTCTCLGGGVALVRPPDLREAMVARERSYASQPGSLYMRKLVKYLLLTAVSGPRWYSIFVRMLQHLTGDYDSVIWALTRGFGDADLPHQIRRRPADAVLRALAARLESYDGAPLRGRAEAAAFVLASLGDGRRQLLGGRAANHTHWLFPVVADDPAALVEAARELGFDATTGASTLSAIGGASSRVVEAMSQVVYLPVYDGIPRQRLQALADLVVRQFATRSQAEHEMPRSLQETDPSWTSPVCRA